LLNPRPEIRLWEDSEKGLSIGGSGDEPNGPDVGPEGTLYVAGSSTSSNWPTKNAYQNVFTGNVNSGIGNIVLAKFAALQGLAGGDWQKYK
jgi:hypothetical protein